MVCWNACKRATTSSPVFSDFEIASLVQLEQASHPAINTIDMASSTAMPFEYLVAIASDTPLRMLRIVSRFRRSGFSDRFIGRNWCLPITSVFSRLAIDRD